jgi:3',5'-cyclic AMP phosphodiesterase CpdA
VNASGELVIAHLSDLHFGTERPDTVEALHARLLVLRPDLVVVSGDLTQRATDAQFARARDFLRRLAGDGLETLCVPGNHDVPLWGGGDRLRAPLARYRRHVSADLCPTWRDPRAVVQGLSSARRFTGKNGRINRVQRLRVARTFAGLPEHTLRIVAVHHPLLALPWGPDGATLPAVHGGSEALAAFVDAGAHVVLSGHHHRSHAEDAAATDAADRSLLVVQAGTALSSRTRHEQNAFNVLRAAWPTLSVGTERCESGEFGPVGTPRTYVRSDGRWLSPSRPSPPPA